MLNVFEVGFISNSSSGGAASNFGGVSCDVS